MPVAKKTGTGRMSRITQTIYESAKDLHAAGAIDQTTMREFDAICLPPVPKYSATRIKALRARCKCSQPVFAKYLNVTPSSLRQWETGAKQPAGAACKLLDVIERKGLEALT
jgi:putative transcriptional regulator